MGMEYLLYRGLLVNKADVGSSFELMGKGMLGVFVVMLLIYLVIVILNKIGKSKDKKNK